MSDEEREQELRRVKARLYREYRRGLLTEREYEAELKAAEEYV